jgi:hypothetical protein
MCDATNKITNLSSRSIIRDIIKMGLDYQETEEVARKGKKDYYNSGSIELATDTPLTLNRLETVSFDSSHLFIDS